MSERKAKISVVLSLEDFERYQAYCEEKGFKKSTLIARLVRDHMDAAGYQLQRPLLIPAQRVDGAKRKSNRGETKK
jgi:hypothetical protein